MTPKEYQSQISLLDNAYQKMSDLHFKGVGVFSGREEGWFRFIQAGFTLHDLDVVLYYLNQRIREGKRDKASERWSTLIGNLDRFQEELSLAEAVIRNQKHPPSPKDTVLAQAFPVHGGGTPALVPNTARPAADLIPDLLRKMREAVEKGETQ